MKARLAILVLLFFSVSTVFSPAGQTETNHTTNNFDPAALGLEEPIDESTAQFLTVKAKAEKGDVEAQFDLGMCFEHGQGATRNPPEAAKWFRKAAEHGNASAQYELATMYYSGKGVAQDYAEAAKWSRKAAEQGHPTAQLYLGTMYDSGKGVAQDSTEAAKWSRKAAEQGYAVAQLYLGELYTNGNGVPKDYVEAYKWIDLCAAQDVRFSPNPTYCKRFLSSLESMMTPEQVAKAKQLALEFKPRNAPEPCELASGSATPNLGSTGEASIATPATPPVTPPSSPKSAQTSNTTPALDPSVGSSEKRQYSEQQITEMLLTTPFFSLPKAIQEWYIRQFRDGMRKQGFEVTDAEIIQQYYRRQQMALPPSNVQQYYGYQKQAPESRKRSSASATLDSIPSSSGTGFFITVDGYLITNGHVVKDAAQVRVVTSAETISAKVVQVDAANDLALLKAVGQFAALPVASSRSVALGGTVATVGFPDPGLQGFSPKLAKGEIAALAGAGDDARYFQISVPLQPGNSGGALVDVHANVVGIVSAKLDAATALASSGTLPENVNYAVKSSFLLSFLESVPDLSAKLKAPNSKEEQFQDVVKAAQDAAVLVLVY
jgi:S1-C subfamily serine protease